MVSAGDLVWISVKPLLKMAITTACGVFLTRADLFGGVAARGAGQVIVNITLPALLFSKIVPSFTAESVRALGPLILLGLLYQLFGLIFAFIVRQFFWVPHRFRYGILAAGTWMNWGDIPTAVIVSITSGAPFTSGDSDLAVAYIAIFILVFYITLFPLGGHLLIAKDFEGPDFTDDEVRESFSSKVKKTGHQLSAVPSTLSSFLRRRRQPTPPTVVVDVEKQLDEKVTQALAPLKDGHNLISPTTTIIGERRTASKQVTFGSANDAADYFQSQEKGSGASSHDDDVQPASTPYAATVVSTAVPEDGAMTDEKGLDTRPSSPFSPPPAARRPVHPVLRKAWAVLKSLYTPPTITIFISFPVALVPQLKRLFVAEPGSPVGPDGLPALQFLMDTATFIGNASVPLGLVCLGSALARMNVPRPFTRLPLGAISTFALTKMFLMPVIGVLLVQLFTTAIPIIDKNDKVLRFVCIFFSAVPTATTQVYLTQVHSPDGNAEHLSAFLIPQYALMFISMTVLNAFAVNLLFS